MVIKIVICYTSSFNLDYHLIYTYHLPLDYIGLEAANLDALMLICHKKILCFKFIFVVVESLYFSSVFYFYISVDSESPKILAENICATATHSS